MGVPKIAVVKAAAYALGTAVLEVIAIIIGVIRLDDAVDNNPHYIPVPNWVFYIAPAVVGLFIFFRTWYQMMESNPHDKDESRS